MDRKKKIARGMLIVLLLCGGIALFREFSGYQQEKGQENVLVKWMEQSTMELYLPAVKMREGAAGNMGEGNLWTRLLLYPYPVFLGILEQEEQKPDVCAESDYEQLLLLEGTDEDRKNIAQDDLAYEENALHLGSEMEDALQKENGLYMENQAALSEQEARERESAEEIYRSAHALKGLASVLGLKKLALAADELAERARLTGAPPDGKYFEAVTDEYTRVVGLIARML